MLQDLRYAFRTLAKDPVFAAVAVMSLALGIGANTAIFTLVDQLLLRLLPVKDPHSIVVVDSVGEHYGSNEGDTVLSYPMYQEFGSASPFESVICRVGVAAAAGVDGSAEMVQAELVSGNFFEVLGVRPAVGRVFSPQEDDRVWKGHPHVVLSHHYWLSRFQGDPGVVGKKILVNNYPMTVVGVSAAGFLGLDPVRSPHLRIPIQMEPVLTPGQNRLGDRRARWVQVFARVKPGYTADRAELELQPKFHAILESEVAMPDMAGISAYRRDRFLEMRARVRPAKNGYGAGQRRGTVTAMWALMGMVGAVLLIACFNVAGLLVARGASRRKEIAVRLSMGATRGRLLRQLLVESLVLASLGGLAGAGLAVWMGEGIGRLMPRGSTPLLLTTAPSGRALAFCAVVSLATAILFGLAPAIGATRLELASWLKQASGAVTGGGAVRWRKGLVTAQVALGFLLLFVAGLFLKSLGNLKNRDTGYGDLSTLVSFRANPALVGRDPASEKQLYRDLLAELKNLPGVEGAALARQPILAGFSWDSNIQVEGHQARDGEDMQAYLNAVSPGFFAALGVPLLEGRDFDEREDSGDRPQRVIVNRQLADHYFGKRGAIGRWIQIGSAKAEIVGVAANTLYDSPTNGVPRQVFLPQFQMGAGRARRGTAFYVRARSGSDAVFGAIRSAVRRVDSRLPIYDLRTTESALDETLTAERMIGWLSGLFGVMATILGGIGLYGVMAFVVTRRSKEMGLRMALGATPTSVVRMVLTDAVRLVAFGLLLGVPAGLMLGRAVSSQLYDVGAWDPSVALAAVAVLGIAAGTAGWLPARRASRIDPMQALRYE